MNSDHRKLADLHTHLYGCIHSADFRDFVKRRDVDWTGYASNFEKVYGVSPNITDILERCRAGTPGAEDEFHRLFVFSDDDAGNFDRFQAKYDVLMHGGDSARFSRGEVSLSVLIDSVCWFIHRTIAEQHRQNVGYIEQRMNVGLRYSRGQAEELIRAMLTSYSKYADSDIQPRLAVSLPRENPWPTWEVVKDAALDPLGYFLTGIDFCNVEEGYPPREQGELFDAVKDFNHRHPDRALAILYHVGESFNDKSLESAVRWVHEAAEFGAHRLGHAISLGVDPARYGVHTRSESVRERIDQLNYDLNHRDGLVKFGISGGRSCRRERVGTPQGASRRLPAGY